MKIDESKVLSLYACCIPVKGALRSIVLDLQRDAYFIIPNTMYDMLIKYSSNRVCDVLKELSTENQATYKDYVNFILENDLGRLCPIKSLKNFPKLNSDWKSPSLITNAIIDFENNEEFDISDIVNQLNDLGCKSIDLRFFGKSDVNKIDKILKEFKFSRIQSVFLVVPFLEKIHLDYLLEKYAKLENCIVYDVKSELGIQQLRGRTIFYTSKSLSPKSCGIVSTNYFSTKLENYVESLTHNSCLNRKISIDMNGNIKNCPSMSASFGNIKNDTLNQALDEPGFKSNWTVNKDKIHVCKSCEFRYICTDCRAYVEDPNDILSKPLKCGYNPFNGEWSKWVENPVKQKAMNKYGFI